MALSSLAPVADEPIEVAKVEPISPEQAVLDAIHREERVSPSVAILGLGPSIGQYLDTVKRLGGRHKIADATWGINALGDVFRCDAIFHMDDIRIQQGRAQHYPTRVARAIMKLRETITKGEAAYEEEIKAATAAMASDGGIDSEAFRLAMARAGEHVVGLQAVRKALAEAEAEAVDPESNVSAMLEWMKSHPGPIFTSTVHPDYPGTVEYPLADVLTSIPFGYFNNTCSYAVAYAIHKGFKKISMWGCDFTYANAHAAESGRGCVEFWLGIAAAKGIRLEVASMSSLMDGNVEASRRWYGYDYDDIELGSTSDLAGSQRVTVTRRPRAVVPSAEEIEARYDHSLHPAGEHAGQPGV